LKEITSASHDKKDKILGNCFPYASKFARSVIGLIELYVSMYLYILLAIEVSTLDLLIEVGILETKTDCSGKDRLFSACVAFLVITFEPTMI
jgi:hypothetical protein